MSLLLPLLGGIPRRDLAIAGVLAFMSIEKLFVHVQPLILKANLTSE